MNMTVLFSDTAVLTFDLLPDSVQNQIHHIIHDLSENPYSGRPLDRNDLSFYMRRVNDKLNLVYSVLPDKNTVSIVDIVNRKWLN